MSKLLLNIKVDPNLKDQAQEVARSLGLPLGTIINSYLRNLVNEKRVVFSAPLLPNLKTQKLLRTMARDLKNGVKNFYGPFTTKEAVAHLDRI